MNQAASVARADGLYCYGQTIITACTADPRFHYVMYVPPGVASGTKTRLIIAVHGTTRTSAIEFRDAFARIPIHMIVGGADLETWEITHKEGGRYWMPGANSAGATRPERLASLKRSFESAGAKVVMDVLPGVSHERSKALDNVKSFFHEELTKLRAREVALMT